MTAVRCFVAAAAFVLLAAGSGWDSKATPNERAASNAVGGFSDNDRRLYHQGLEHVYHTHQRVGSFTIRQVVQQERSREATRQARHSNNTSATTQNVNAAVGVLAFVVLLLIGIGIAFASLKRTKGQAAINSLQMIDDSAFRLGPLRPVSGGNVIPAAGEIFYWSVHAEALGQIRGRTYLRGTAGVSFRVMRGVYVRGGGSRGHYVDNTHFGVIDSGQLLLSNVRLLFVGATGETAYVGYQRIVAVEPFDQGFRVISDKGAPTTYRTGSPHEAIVLRRLIAGDIADHRQPPPRVVSAGFEVTGDVIEAPDPNTRS